MGEKPDAVRCKVTLAIFPATQIVAFVIEHCTTLRDESVERLRIPREDRITLPFRPAAATLSPRC